jgi:hypothetical protein
VFEVLDNLSLRLAYSQTVGRPSLREISPFFNKSIETGNLVIDASDKVRLIGLEVAQEVFPATLDFNAVTRRAVRESAEEDVLCVGLILNRILSGTAEACASGADEALAYDSLPEAERTRQWPAVMARLSRLMALGFIVSSISGGLLYDHARVLALLDSLGLPALERLWTMKLPLLLNLVAALACLGVALRLREPGSPPALGGSWTQETARALRGMLATGAWIWRHEAAFRLLVLAIVFDSIIRLFLTVASNFYRLVGIDEAWYGVIGTVASLLGLASAGLMERMTRHGRERDHFLFVAALTLAGLLGVAHPQPGWTGIALILPLMLAMRSPTVSAVRPMATPPTSLL